MIVTDLSQTDQDYYTQIGGLTDVEMTMYKQANIDSLSKTADIAMNGSQIGEPPSFKRQRLSNVENHNNSNNSEFVSHRQRSDSVDLTSPCNFASSANDYNFSPSLASPPKLEKAPLNDALSKLNNSLTQYEEEQVQKKKELAVLLTNEKTKAYMTMFALKLGSHPELLGVLPSASLEDQLTAGFDLWLYDFKQTITAKVDDIYHFINQVTLMRTDHQEWISFLHKWKLQRIFYRDEFTKIWQFMVQELHIDVRTDVINEAEEEHLDLNISLA